MADFNERLGEDSLQAALLACGNCPRVLEIGCGEGRVLLELRREFPDAELHGLNESPWTEMQGSESLRETAVYYGVFSQPEIAAVDLPDIHFHNAESLCFPDQEFDIVYSQVAIPHIRRKERLLGEVWRILKPGGLALLHLDSVDWASPDFIRNGRWIVYDENGRVPLERIFARLTSQGFDIAHKTRQWGGARWSRQTFLRVRKGTQRRLDLRMTFDPVSSFDIAILNHDEESWGGYWGYRSVYRLDSDGPPFDRDSPLHPGPASHEPAGSPAAESRSGSGSASSPSSTP